MFSKLIPNSVAAGSGPRQPRTEADLRKAKIAARDPTFRTARHKVQPPHDPKAPPRVESSAVHAVVAPGRRIEATDRTYTVGHAGELRREVTNRGRRQRKPSRAEQRARDRQAERIEAELARREAKKHGRGHASAPRPISDQIVAAIERDTDDLERQRRAAGEARA